RLRTWRAQNTIPEVKNHNLDAENHARHSRKSGRPAPKRPGRARAVAADPPSGIAGRAVERALAGRRAAYEEEVRRLVAAAFLLIERSGSLEPRVGDVVREARLSNQAFYRHFPTKQALLVAVLDEGVRMLASYLAHRMASAPTPTARVEEGMRGMLEQALAPGAPAAPRPFVLARSRLAQAHPEEVAESERQLTALVREALRAARDA